MTAESIESFLPSLLGLVGVIIGAIIAWWLPTRTAKRQRDREIEQAIATAVSICLGRLWTLHMALREGKDEIYRNEKHFLGNDIGQFLQAISRRPKLDPDEFQLFQRMNEVLMETVSETQLEAHLESLKGDLRSRISDAA